MSSAIQTLLNAVTVAGAGSSLNLSAIARYQGGAHTFEISGTFVGSINIQGSIDGGATWHTLQAMSAPGIYSDTGVYTHLRGNVTSYTSGSITLKALYGLLENLTSSINTLQNAVGDVQAAQAVMNAYLITLLSDTANLTTESASISSNLTQTATKKETNNLIKQLKLVGKIL